MLSDEQMRKRWLFSPLSDEQMSNKVGVEHQPDKVGKFFSHYLQVRFYISQVVFVGFLNHQQFHEGRVFFLLLSH